MPNQPATLAQRACADERGPGESVSSGKPALLFSAKSYGEAEEFGKPLFERLALCIHVECVGLSVISASQG